jgi:hypothetical protein
MVTEREIYCSSFSFSLLARGEEEREKEVIWGLGLA